MKAKTLYIDASRIKSGGGILHLKEILKTSKLNYFDNVIVFSHLDLKNQIKNINQKVQVKTNYFLNKNIFTSLIWQLIFLKKEIKNKNSILLTLDSTSLCNYKFNVVINQDIIGFQKGSLEYFKGRDFIYNIIKYLISKRQHKNCFASIFTSNYAKNLITKKQNYECLVIPHGVNENIKPKKEYSLVKPDEFNIVYVSPILSYKNHNYIIETITKNNFDFKLKIHFIGGGDKNLIKKLKSEIKKNKLENNFTFHPFLTHDHVFKLIKNSDVGLFTSSIECFGISLLEYMRSGLPIICSNSSSLPETLNDSGVYIDLNQKDDLMNAINLFYYDKDLRRKLGKKAYKRSLDYSWETTSNKTIEYIIKNYERANMC